MIQAKKKDKKQKSPQKTWAIIAYELVSEYLQTAQ